MFLSPLLVCSLPLPEGRGKAVNGAACIAVSLIFPQGAANVYCRLVWGVEKFPVIFVFLNDHSNLRRTAFIDTMSCRLRVNLPSMFIVILSRIIPELSVFPRCVFQVCSHLGMDGPQEIKVLND